MPMAPRHLAVFAILEKRSVWRSIPPSCLSLTTKDIPLLSIGTTSAFFFYVYTLHSHRPCSCRPRHPLNNIRRGKRTKAATNVYREDISLQRGVPNVHQVNCGTPSFPFQHSSSSSSPHTHPAPVPHSYRFLHLKKQTHIIRIPFKPVLSVRLARPPLASFAGDRCLMQRTLEKTC